MEIQVNYRPYMHDGHVAFWVKESVVPGFLMSAVDVLSAEGKPILMHTIIECTTCGEGFREKPEEWSIEWGGPVVPEENKM